MNLCLSFGLWGILRYLQFPFHTHPFGSHSKLHPKFTHILPYLALAIRSKLPSFYLDPHSCLFTTPIHFLHFISDFFNVNQIMSSSCLKILQLLPFALRMKSKHLTKFITCIIRSLPPSSMTFPRAFCLCWCYLSHTGLYVFFFLSCVFHL